MKTQLIRLKELNRARRLGLTHTADYIAKKVELGDRVRGRKRKKK